MTRVGKITLDLHKLLSVSLKLTLTTAIHDWQQAPHISPVRARRGMCVVNSGTKIHQFCHCCDEIIYVLNWSAIFREPTICNHLKVSPRVGWVHCNKVPMATPSLCLCCMLYWATIHRESFPASLLTHWGPVTHICVGNLTIIGSDNDLSPGRRHAIAWTSVGINWTARNKLQWNVNRKSYIFTQENIFGNVVYRTAAFFVSASMCLIK